MRPGTGRPPYCLNWEDTKRIADIVFNNLAHEMPHNSHAETGQPPYVSILLQTSPLIILNYIETGNSSQARVVLRCWGFPGPDWAWWIIVHSREAHSFYYFHPKETTFYFSISISLYIGHFHKFVFPLLGGLEQRAAQQHRCTELFNKPQDRRNNISREARYQNVSWWKIRLHTITTSHLTPYI